MEDELYVSTEASSYGVFLDAVFSSVCYYEPGAEPTYINAYDPELSSIKEVLNMVSNNLFSYLQKPLLQQDFD